MVLLISSLIESIVGFLASLLVFYAISWSVNGIHPTRYTLFLLVIFPIQILFNLGLSGIVARMAVPFRDINNFLPYINRLWLYLSPIIWSLSFLDDADPTLRTLVEINPMFHIIALYRAALLGPPDYLFDTGDLIITLAWALGIFVIGVAGFIRYETRMVRYL
jgi:teichoic acid transport system permease protein